MTAGIHFSDEVDEAMREEFEMVNLLTDFQLMEMIGAAGMDPSCVPGPDDRICAYYGIKRRRSSIRYLMRLDAASCRRSAGSSTP
jgi:hypothetical protein